MRNGFQLIHKDDLCNTLAGLLIANQAIKYEGSDYQAGFAAAVVAISAAIGKQNELLAKTRRLHNGLV